MRRFFLCAAIIAASTLSARAQSAPPPALWQGFYVGLNAGYTWSASDSLTTDATTIRCLSFGGACNPGTVGLALATGSALGATGVWPARADGFIGGGQIGRNWQFGSFVAGVETDIQGVAGGGASTNGFSVVPVQAPVGGVVLTGLSASTQLDYLGTLRARFGFLVTPTFMVYGTAGMAYGGVSANASMVQTFAPPFLGSPPAFGGGSFSDTLVGWTAGGGGEWMFAPRWSAKVEYLYYDLGAAAFTFPVALQFNPDGEVSFLNLVRARPRFDGHIVRLGVNYHFDWF